jgi:hypothetical protein
MDEKNEYTNIISLSANYMKTKGQAHKYFIEKFDLPSYYGKNLDALWDVLTERREKTHIVIQGVEKLLENLGDYGSAIIDLFEDLEHEYDNYTIEKK